MFDPVGLSTANLLQCVTALSPYGGRSISSHRRFVWVGLASVGLTLYLTQSGEKVKNCFFPPLFCSLKHLSVFYFLVPSSKGVPAREKKKALTCYLSHLCPSLLKNNARSHCRRRSSLSAVNKWADATLGEQMGRVFLFFIYSVLSSGPEVQTDHADRAAAAKSAATGG